MIHIDFTNIKINVRPDGDKSTVFDPVRKKWLILTPEEHVRQHILGYMIHVMQYPASLISVEKNIKVGSLNKRFDIVVYDRSHKPWLLTECKAPEVPISEKTLWQLLNYQNIVQCSYWLLTNGLETYCADACDVENIKWCTSLPQYL